MAGREVIDIRPQPGPQTEFLSTPADIAIYGGAAGGGKSWGLLMEPCRHIDKPRFGGVIFRREREMVTNEGGLWDESAELYPPLKAKPNNADIFWTFPSRATVGFAGLKLPLDVLKWQGSQIPYLGFDELTHFLESQFFYMLSRNRSARAGVRSYVRATCNPDADSWVRDFIGWWIDPKTGFADTSRAGVIRYLIRDQDKNHWFDSPSDARDGFPELVDQFGPEIVKSVTFIPADIFDNPALIAADPGYLANLMALPLVERERLLRGNWNVRASAGKVYNRDWFEIIDSDRLTKGGIDVRFWDLAATAKKAIGGKNKDPDFTATIKLRYKNDQWTIIDAFQIQAPPAQVEKLVFATAEFDKRQAAIDGTRYVLRWEIEPGSASRRESYRWTTHLRGIDAKGEDTKGEDKLSRARACSVQAEHGNVKVLRADWTNMLLNHLHGFPDLGHDDLFDALSGAFKASNDAQGGGAMSD
jgi:predicted phage terminase large subunit-like protein